MVISWLLSILCILPAATQTIHIYRNNSCEGHCSHTGDQDHPDHDCSSCPVCRFVLFSFTEANIYSLDTFSQEFYTRVFSFYENKIHNSITHSGYLRAPLFASA